MDDGGAVIFFVFLSLVGGWLMGISVDSDYKFLQERVKWAEEVCKDHKGPDSIDTSFLFSAEVTCANGVKIKDEKK